MLRWVPFLLPYPPQALPASWSTSHPFWLPAALASAPREGSEDSTKCPKVASKAWLQCFLLENVWPNGKECGLAVQSCWRPPASIEGLLCARPRAVRIWGWARWSLPSETQSLVRKQSHPRQKQYDTIQLGSTVNRSPEEVTVHSLGGTEKTSWRRGCLRGANPYPVTSKYESLHPLVKPSSH